MKLFSFKTTYIQLFKNLIDSLKDIMIESNITFSKNGINMCKMNSMNTICCFVKLSNIKLNTNGNEYICEYPENKPLIAGLNLLHFFKILKTIGNNHNLLDVYIDDTNKNIMHIKVLNQTRLVISNYVLNLIEITENNMTIPSVQFDAEITIDSKFFQKQLKDFYSLDTNCINIKLCSKQLHLSNFEGFICRNTIIDNNENIITTTDQQLKSTLNIVYANDDVICQGKYEVKHLLLCTSKFTTLSQNMTLKFKNDIPLIIDINMPNFGNVILVVASC
jgi:proliferating cell nuclear antigen